MRPTKKIGIEGEFEVIRLIPCPNCGKRLTQLPPNYPLYDIQCTGCSFRAQVKTNQSKPKDVIRGAGWEVIHKVLKSGFMIPPLIVNYKWRENGVKRQEILFYPFIPKSNLKKYQLSPNHRHPNYKMFHYVGLLELPRITLYPKQKLIWQKN